jgi:glycosyltransferase involved in cell wall biosynthesis
VELEGRILNDDLSRLVDILVVVQFSEQEGLFLEGGSRVIFTTESGLSKSRNKVIDYCETEYFWILDDDVLPTIQDIKKILTSIEEKSIDIFIGQIRCSDRDGDYKDYSRSRSGKLGLLRVSSIEVIVKKDFVLDKKIIFNEQLGLGSRNPAGEEICFLLDAYSAGAKFKFINENIISHPCSNELRIVRSQNNLSRVMIAEGYIARKIGGISGFLLMLYWQMKFFAHYKRLTVLISIFKGYFFRGML